MGLSTLERFGVPAVGILTAYVTSFFATLYARQEKYLVIPPPIVFGLVWFLIFTSLYIFWVHTYAWYNEFFLNLMFFFVAWSCIILASGWSILGTYVGGFFLTLSNLVVLYFFWENYHDLSLYQMVILAGIILWVSIASVVSFGRYE